MDIHLLHNISKPKKMRALSMMVLVIMALVASSYGAHAQQASGTLDRQQIVLGEQAILRLKIKDIPEGYSLVSFFGWDSTSHAEVVSKERMDTINLNSQYTYIQDWKITSFDSGKWSLPISAALLMDQKTGQKMELSIDSVYLDVLPVDISNMKDYHDIKDILTVKYFDPFWIITGVVVLILVGLLVLLFRYLIKRKKKKPSTQNKIASSPLDWALGEIEKLQGQKLSMYVYFGSIKDVVRTYLHERANLPTQYETSDELILRMRDLYKSDVVADSFYQNLKLMDAVKFAKFQPSEEAKNQKTIEIVEALKLFDKKIKEQSTK